MKRMAMMVAALVLATTSLSAQAEMIKFDFRDRDQPIYMLKNEWGDWTRDQEHGVEVYGTGVGSKLLGAGDDILVTNNSDIVFGGPGGDRIEGLGGDDWLHGGAGNDFLIGGPGNDVLIGGYGDDILIDGRGNDILIGGKGRDQYFINRYADNSTDIIILNSVKDRDVFDSRGGYVTLRQILAGKNPNVIAKKARIGSIDLPSITIGHLSMTLDRDAFENRVYQLTSYQIPSTVDGFDVVEGTQYWTNTTNVLIEKK